MKKNKKNRKNQKNSQEQIDERILKKCTDLKLELHKKAELFESRINDGKSGYEEIHPAISAELAATERDSSDEELKMEQEENDRYQNYETIVPVTKIPSFWEPRPWDQSENKMSKEDENTLHAKITDWKDPPPIDKFTFNNRPNTAICPHSEIPSTDGKKSYKHSIRLNKRYQFFETDDTDTDEELLLC